MEKILVPNIGTDDLVEVIEVLVQPGDAVDKDASLIVLESDKASMEVPAPFAGTINALLVKEGDKVKEGMPIADILPAQNSQPGQTAESSSQAAGAAVSDDAEQTGQKSTPDVRHSDSNLDSADGSDRLQQTAMVTTQPDIGSRTISIPNIGTEDAVEVIEVLVQPGDTVDKGASLIVLESDKASMEVPAPEAGIIDQLLVQPGDKVKEGTPVVTIKNTQNDHAHDAKEAVVEKEQKKSFPAASTQQSQAVSSVSSPVESNAVTVQEYPADQVHAGPAVRKLAREFGINLGQVKPSGPKHRILKEDLQAFVKSRLNQHTASGQHVLMQEASQGMDFAQFGPVEKVSMSKIHKITADHMLRSWMTVPQVSQFETADITELEAFRQQQKSILLKQQIRLTVLPFVIAAICRALSEHPEFNVSLQDGYIIKKKYMHIGVAMDTPHGLMVPVIRNADQKNIRTLAQELQELADQAKNKKLLPNQMQGGCFSISSLGSLGGTQFTPLVNAPEVGILGLSKAQVQPVYLAESLKPRLILPLVLSYDHRAVNGADALRFITSVKYHLEDIRHLLI